MARFQLWTTVKTFQKDSVRKSFDLEERLTDVDCHAQRSDTEERIQGNTLKSRIMNR